MFLDTDKMVLAIFLHFLSDFLLQSRKVATKKSSNYTALFIHCSIICLVFLPFFGWKFALINSSLHGIIDRNIWNIYKYFRRNEKIKTFKFWEDSLFFSTIGFDQFLHVLCLIILLNNNV